MFSLTGIRQELKEAEVYGTANPYTDVPNKLMGKNRTSFGEQGENVRLCSD
jgi:hypothetical protein